MFLDMLQGDPLMRECKQVYPTKASAVKAMCQVMRESKIDGVCRLSGYRAGMHEINGRRIMVPTEPRKLWAKKGAFPFLTAYFDAVCREMPEQRDVLWSWMKLAFTKWSKGDHSPLQMMILVGPSGTGKSLFQEICKRLLGGTIADPYDFLIGRTEFNLELAENALLSFEDRPSFDMKKQRMFFDRVKNLLMSRDQRVRGLYRDGFMADPIRFLMASINAQAHNYSMVPPRENGYEDKFVFTYFSNTGFPLRGWERMSEKEFFDKVMTEELPGLAHFLVNEYEIPEWLLTRVGKGDKVCGRYGMDSWWHPDIAAISSEGSDCARLVGVLEALLESKGAKEPLKVSARALADMLKEMDVDGAYELGDDAKKLGYKLRDAALNFPKVVQKGGRGNKGVIWMIKNENMTVV